MEIAGLSPAVDDLSVAFEGAQAEAIAVRDRIPTCHYCRNSHLLEGGEGNHLSAMKEAMQETFGNGHR